MSNIPKSSTELYTDYAEQIAQNPGVKLGYEKEEVAEPQPNAKKESKTSVESVTPLVESPAKKTRNFRDKVEKGNGEEYELAVQELFVRSVSTVFNSIYNQINDNPEYKKYTKKKDGDGIEFFRDIEEIKDSGRYEELESSQIDRLVKLLTDQAAGTDNFPPNVVNRLERIILRVKKLNSIRDSVEKRPILLGQIEETQSKLKIGKQTGYELMVSEKEAQTELELAQSRVEIAKQTAAENIASNKQLEVGLNALRIKQGLIPVDRRVVPRPINARQISTDIKVGMPATATETTEANLIQIESVAQPKVLTKLELLAQQLEKQKKTPVADPEAVEKVEAVETPIVEGRELTNLLESKKIENNNKILGNIQGRLNTHYNNLKGVNQIMEQLNLFEQTTALKIQPKFKELSTLVGVTFSDMSQRVLILSSLRAMLSTKIEALKKSKPNRNENIGDKLNLENLNLCPAIKLSKNVEAALKNEGSLQVAKTNALINIINKFYIILEQKAKESDFQIPNFHDTFVTCIIRGSQTDYFGHNEYDQFMVNNQSDFELFNPTNWEIKTKNYILNGNKITAGVILGGNACRLYVIRKEDGDIYFDSYDDQFTHIPEGKNIN
jgi:hypothetical protein